MQNPPTILVSASRYELLARSFELLALDPAATKAQIEQALASARKQVRGSDQVLTEARDRILDAKERLLCELCYPLDSNAEHLEAFYKGLSSKTIDAECRSLGTRLPPLSAANFMARLAGRGETGPDVVRALVAAHAALDATTIFNILRDKRTSAGFPMPSLVEIGQGVRVVQSLHLNAVLAAYRPIQDAATTLTDCTRQILSSGDRYRIDALADLLNAYRQSLSSADSRPSHEVESSSETVKQYPADALSIRAFESALNNSILMNAPLIVMEAHQQLPNYFVEKAITGIDDLIGALKAAGHHRAAHKIAAVSVSAFSTLPELTTSTPRAATWLHKMSVDASFLELVDLIRDFSLDPADLVASLKKGGFGDTAMGSAKTLLAAFSAAVAAASDTEMQARPWEAVRNLFLALDARPGSARTILIVDLLRLGELAPAPQAMLDLLRQDLSATCIRSSAAIDRTGKRRLWATAAIVLLLPLTLCLIYFSHPYVSSVETPSAEPTQADLELVPPVSTGEKYKLEFVRYCHFQEERLRVIKQHANGAEDAQAFNMLANDYNSRCSNFYYRDDDLKIVMEEVTVKKQRLEADAMRILSTWPWHTTTSSPGK